MCRKIAENTPFESLGPYFLGPNMSEIYQSFLF